MSFWSRIPQGSQNDTNSFYSFCFFIIITCSDHSAEGTPYLECTNYTEPASTKVESSSLLRLASTIPETAMYAPMGLTSMILHSY